MKLHSALNKLKVFNDMTWIDSFIEVVIPY